MTDQIILAALCMDRAGQKEAAIGLGISVPAMIQQGLWLLDDPEVERAHPDLVRRARRILAARRRSRGCP